MSTNRVSKFIQLSIDNDDRIVINCPVCRRVIWNGATCAHGVVPPMTPVIDLTGSEDKEVFKEKKNKGGLK